MDFDVDSASEVLSRIQELSRPFFRSSRPGRKARKAGNVQRVDVVGHLVDGEETD